MPECSTCRSSGIQLRICLLFVFAALTGLGASSLSAQEGLLGSFIPSGDFIQQTVSSKQIRCEVEPGDQLWVISTRETVTDKCCGQLKVASYKKCNFAERTLDDLAVDIQSAPEIPTVFYVHGNFTDLGWSLQRGCEVYREMFGGRNCRSSVRFVIWSWKTEREAGPVKDFSLKVGRSVEEGARLIEVINRVQVEHPVVIGYSLGCQVVLSSLTQADQTPQSNWRIGLIAPALECRFDTKLCQFPLHPEQVSSLSVFTNERDRALRYAGLRCKILRCGESPFDQHAMIPYLSLGGVQPEVWDISKEVGRKHAIGRYIGSPTMVNVLRQVVEQVPSMATEIAPTAEAEPAPLEPEPAIIVPAPVGDSE